MKHNINKYLWVFREKTETLLSSALPKYLSKAGYAEWVENDDYAYFPGDIPILLVAHVDTVHKELPAVICFDKNTNSISSPTGIGADDRAGIAAILALVDMGHRPHILFCNEEECGGWGARSAVKVLNAPDVRYIIELDRKGSGESVFYDCANEDFEEYINSFDFETEWGSFSDISFLCPVWEVAGVNLSVGYHSAHTLTETLNLSEWNNAIEKVGKMLKSPPDNTFAYIPAEKHSYYGGYYGSQYDADYTNKRIFIYYTASYFHALIGGSLELWEQFIRDRGADISCNVGSYIQEEADRYYDDHFFSFCDEEEEVEDDEEEEGEIIEKSARCK